MAWKETDQEVLDRMHDWANLIADKIFEKETIGIPHAVAILGAVEFVVKRIKQSSVVTPAAILKILENKLYEQGDDGCTQEKKENN